MCGTTYFISLYFIWAHLFVLLHKFKYQCRSSLLLPLLIKRKFRENSDCHTLLMSITGYLAVISEFIDQFEGNYICVISNNAVEGL
jgi:hypothetical protein